MEIEEYNLNEELIFNCTAEANFHHAVSDSELLILHLNIRSIKKNFMQIETMISTLKHKPDVIICSEAWLIGNIKFINITGYTHFNNDSRINKADGVIMYVNKNLQFQTVNEQFNDLKITSLLIELTSTCSVKISGLYCCHDYEIDNFITGLDRFILSNKTVANHIILGDVNLDLIEFNKKPEENFYQLLQNEHESMINTWTHPTRSYNEGSCIDHIFKKGKLVALSGIITEFITDHYPVLISIHGNNIKYKVKEH